jgi:hypothetical protein
VYSLTGVSVFVTDRDSTGVTDWLLRTREQCYEWQSVCIFAGSSVQHLFGRGTHMIVLVLDLNGLTFYQGSCQCSIVRSQDGTGGVRIKIAGAGCHGVTYSLNDS